MLRSLTCATWKPGLGQKPSKTIQIIQESTENTKKTIGEVKNIKKIKIKKDKRIKKSEIQEKLNSYGIFCKGNISVLKQKLDNIENIIIDLIIH